MRTKADKEGRGVKNHQIFADVLYVQPLSNYNHNSQVHTGNVILATYINAPLLFLQRSNSGVHGPYFQCSALRKTISLLLAHF